jgi:hypothetical protein
MAFCASAESYIKTATKTKALALPANKEVIFYLLTNKGKYRIVERVEKLMNDSSEWNDLFSKANAVITELRKLTPKEDPASK